MMKRLRRRLGRVRSKQDPSKPPRDGDLSDVVEALGSLLPAVRPYTMTGVARIGALVDSVRYLVDRGIEGAFVECGVWRGGSVLAMIHTLQEMGAAHRDIYLYDTFEGMTEPTEHDISMFDGSALDEWKAAQQQGKRAWSALFAPEMFGESDIKKLLLATGYPADRLHFVRGPVEQTIPDTIPESIALLRLDTDWYESTLHELQHLYPRVSQAGALIIDDYGHWKGCRQAVDEYFGQTEVETPLFTRIDYTGRIAIKC